jgi:hypothetical protein
MVMMALAFDMVGQTLLHDAHELGKDQVMIR